MKGFTLIELMIVVVIIGIITTISYPIYSYLLIKSHRSEAMASLTKLQITLERCYAKYFSYITACDLIPVTFPQKSAQNHYNITLGNLSTTTYTLTATALGNQKKDTTCTQFIVNEQQIKTAYDSSGVVQEHCWL